VGQRGDHDAERLRQNDVSGGLEAAQSEGMGGLDLAVIDRLDTSPYDLGHICPVVETKPEDGKDEVAHAGVSREEAVGVQRGEDVEGDGIDVHVEEKEKQDADAVEPDDELQQERCSTDGFDVEGGDAAN